MDHTNTIQPTGEPMPVEQALETLASVRRPGQIVVTNQMSARLWPQLSQQPLDLNYNPSTMGGAVPLGLGLALAQPQREVLVVSGEGALLMSLGSLVTVVDSRATNLTIILLDNGQYEVTGGQRTPASRAGVDFAGLARAAGFPHVTHAGTHADWQQHAAKLLAGDGPRFAWLEVQPCRQRPVAGAGPAIHDRVKALQESLEEGWTLR